MTDLPRSTKAQAVLALADGRPIDYAVQPPQGCKGDLVPVRPCDRSACRYFLPKLEERAGRPHEIGARPPVKLLPVLPGTATCMWDEIKATPDGMTCDDIAPSFATTGERVRQIEARARLKMEAVEYWRGVIDHAMPNQPPGTYLANLQPHNENELPNFQFLDLAIAVDAKQDTRAKQPHAGVMVRKRRKVV